MGFGELAYSDPAHVNFRITLCNMNLVNFETIVSQLTFKGSVQSVPNVLKESTEHMS